jgi:hypothetical protein
MAGVRVMPAKSKQQARFLGAIASGRIKRKSISKSTAREMLRGTKVKRLPKRAPSARKRKRKR